jgi:zinc D-Ala-D-Ala dipeptidase
MYCQGIHGSKYFLFDRKEFLVHATCMENPVKSARTAAILAMTCCLVLAVCGDPGRGTDHGAAAPAACSRVPDGFTNLSDIAGMRIDVRYATTSNFTGASMDGYGAPCAWMVTPAARALERAYGELAQKGYGLKVLDAYRPLRAQRYMIRWAQSAGKAWLVGTYISGVVNTEATYGHPCGNTVDLTLTDTQGRELDMGSDFDEFSERAWTKNATGKAREYRAVLKEAMERQGFKNYHMEWWHFTFMQPFKARDVVIE